MNVTIIGPYPPPYGGISVHVMRLKDFLISSGLQVTVLDYAKTDNSTKRTKVYNLSLLPWHSILSLVEALRGKKARIVHVHISAAERYLGVGFLLWLAALGQRTILTIHSGRLSSVVDKMSKVKRALFGWIIRRFNLVIAVSVEQSNLLRTCFMVPEERIHVIPAFLPPGDHELRVSSSKLSRRQVLASGFGIPIYGYEVLLSAVKKLIGQGLEFETKLLFYTEIDASYASKIRMEAENLGVKILESMEPNEFLSLLSHTHVFVRPTFADGDSNALREAHWCGAHVLASDCVKRPAWTQCFPTGNADLLALKLEQLLNTERPGPPTRDSHHSGETILRLYKSLV